MVVKLSKVVGETPAKSEIQIRDRGKSRGMPILSPLNDRENLFGGN